MTGRRTLRSRWRAKVFTTGLVSAEVKVTLLALSDEMAENGYVSVPMTRMVKRLDRRERLILRHYASAIDAGLIARVSRGYEGHTAVYQATLPDPQRVSSTSTLSASRNDTLSTRKRVSAASTPVLRRPGLYTHSTRSEPRAVKPAATAAALFASLPALQAATGTRPETRASAAEPGP
jgi:hypothetical protein